MFVLMDQSYLSQFPQDVMSEDGLTVVTAASYGYDMLGADPSSGMRYLFISGDVAQFELDFATVDGIVKYTVPTTLPTNYIQTCVHEFIYGRTLTKAVIVAWQYPYAEENAVVRKRIDAEADTDEYLAYTQFVDSISDDEGYVADIIGDDE